MNDLTNRLPCRILEVTDYVRAFNDHVAEFNAAEIEATQLLDDSADVTVSESVLVADSDPENEEKGARGKTVAHRVEVTMSRHTFTLALVPFSIFSTCFLVYISTNRTF